MRNYTNIPIELQERILEYSTSEKWKPAKFLAVNLGLTICQINGFRRRSNLYRPKEVIIKKVCGYCKNEFSSTPSQHRKYCSNECRTKGSRKEKSKKKCVICDKEFFASRIDIKTCSPKCRSELIRRIKSKYILPEHEEYIKQHESFSSEKIARKLGLSRSIVARYRKQNGLERDLFRLSEEQKQKIRENSTVNNYKTLREIVDILNVPCTMAVISGFRCREKFRWKDLDIKKVCSYCGNEFKPDNVKEKYCSKKCRMRRNDDKRRQHPEWKKELTDKQYSIKENFVPYQKLAEIIHPSESKIVKIRHRFSLYNPIYGDWTEEKLSFLKQHYLEFTDFELAKKLDMSNPSIIVRKRQQLRLLRPKWCANCRDNWHHCLTCHKLIPQVRTFCGKLCYKKWNQRHMKTKQIRKCPICHIKFECRSKTQVFCSRKCSKENERTKAQLKIRIRPCDVCGKPVPQSGYSVIQKYCSRICYYKGQTKHSWTDNDISVLVKFFFLSYHINGKKSFDFPKELLSKFSRREISMKANQIGLRKIFNIKS